VAVRWPQFEHLAHLALLAIDEHHLMLNTVEMKLFDQRHVLSTK
jgi:hypothetical protein